MVPKAETVLVNGQVRSPGHGDVGRGPDDRARHSRWPAAATDRAGRIEIERNGKTVTKKAKKSDLVQANDTIRVQTRIF